jgi:hypothetical protein
MENAVPTEPAAQAPATDPKRINASPTKDFFIHMLVRDIPLNRAIIDLVDNSADGARRMRKDGSYDGLWVRIEIKPTHFRIADNCGGIPVDIARNYAFRFGRPPESPSIDGSIGQFGVGMKRTFFKLGKELKVESATSSSRFTVDINVDVWKSRKTAEMAEDWHFDFTTLDETAAIQPDQQGTTIKISELHPSVADSFTDDVFVKRVWQEISVAHAVSMDKGLSITLNEVPLRHDPLNLLNSAEIKPAHVDLNYENFGPKPVRVKLYAGVSERSKEEGGWYVFCNGRMVLRADQTNMTVWSEGDRVPKYHADFARFRGLAYFDSDDASLLPWTTTKTGVDFDSAVYRAARQQMIEITRPVLDFLRKLDEERKNFDEGLVTDNPLAKAVSSALSVGISGLDARAIFAAPPPPRPPSGPPTNRIQYSKPESEVTKAKKLLGVTTFREVGEKTFEYYMAYEGGSNGQ